jgi:peptidyl-prolyl cis-trans isomerase-like 1
MQSVVLETSLGDIQLELYWNHAPRVNIGYFAETICTERATQTCQNFAELAKQGYYNGVVFHRIIAVRLIICLSMI